MINEDRLKRYCKDDISLIENYEEAVNDKTKTWHCHHKKETDENLSVNELKRLGLYWHRPAKELIFLTPFEHNTLHNKGERHPNYGKLAWNNGIHHSEEQKKKISESVKKLYKSEEYKQKIKGHLGYGMKGKHHSEEAKKKMSEAHKGKFRSEEHKKHLSEALKGKNKGKHLSEETRNKMKNKSHGPKGKHKVWDNKEHNKYHFE